MAELILPGIQLGGWAWRNVVIALRTHDDAHLLACAAVIEKQMNAWDREFGDDTSGEVRFKVMATLRPPPEFQRSP